MWLKIVRDKEFTSQLLEIAVPVMLQNLIMSGLNTLDTFMITKLGTDSIAGVGLANQIFFFFSFILFGINTGASILMAQYYGKQDIKHLRKSLSYALKFSVLAGILFNVVAFLKPEYLIGLFVDDSSVISEGSKYLQAVSLSYVFTAISFAFGTAMRGTGNPRTPFIASLISFFANAFFNYCFIFGKFGAPALGVVGAAIGTIIARVIEFGVLYYVLVIYKGPLYKNFKTLVESDFEFLKYFLKIISPVVVEETFWSLAQVLYGAAYAKIGIEATAAVQVANSISGLLYVLARGVSAATAVIIGVKIGEGDLKRAEDMAIKSLATGLSMGAVLGILLLTLPKQFLLLFPDLTPEVRDLAAQVLRVLGGVYWVKMYTSVLIVGVLRGGGDVKFSLFLEMFCAWAIGVPLVYIGVLYFKVPLYVAVMLVSMDDICKMVIGHFRIKKKKWIQKVT